MPPADLAFVLREVEQLRRRSWIPTGVAAAAVAVAAVAVGLAMSAQGSARRALAEAQRAPSRDLAVDSIKAEEITLGNGSGSTRINSVGVIVFDHSGKARLGMICNDGSPVFSVADDTGTERASLGSTALTNTKLGGTQQTPESTLVFFDKEGKVLSQLPDRY